MTIRQAAGLEPMHPSIRLHGCHRVGNLTTGLDPASPEAQGPRVVVDVMPASFIITSAEITAARECAQTRVGGRPMQLLEDVRRCMIDFCLEAKQ